MTKQIKHFWEGVSFWMKLKAIIAMFGAGGEITLIITEQSAVWHYITIGATILSILITNVIEDKDNDGIVDLFENNKPNKDE